MALLDSINEEVLGDEEFDNGDEEEATYESRGGRGIGPGSGVSPEEMEELSKQSDASFGPGKFVNNPYGSRTFIPQRKVEQQSEFSRGIRDNRMRQGEAEPDPASQQIQQLLTKPAGVAGRPQIRDLRQLGAVAKALSGVPEEIKKKIFSHLLGIPYEDQRTQTMRDSLGKMLLQRKLSQGDRQATQQGVMQRHQENLQQRQQTQANLQEQRKGQKMNAAEILNLRKQQMKATGDSRKANLALRRDLAKKSIMDSINRLGDKMAFASPEQQVKMGKQLEQLEKLYNKFEGLEPTEEAKTVEGNEGF